VRSQLSTPALATTASGGSSIVVNDNRTFNLGSSSTSGSIDIIEILKKSDRELLDLIEKARSKWNRNR
jgi:hypothetical protein